MNQVAIVVQEQPTLDFVLVGAGPHALAFACRLLESRPDSLYDEKDLTTRHKYHPGLAKGDGTKTKRRKKGQTMAGAPQLPTVSFVAVDESGGWMQKWDKLMHNLDVPHLRSPMSAHPDPFDVTSMIAFAHEYGRPGDLRDLGISARSSGREDKKKVRDHAAYMFTNNDHINLKVPSVPLFHAFCQSLVQRYDLDSRLVKAQVVHVEPCFAAESPDSGNPTSFKVHLSTGQALLTRRVVLATGQNLPRIPEWVPAYCPNITHSDKLHVTDPTFCKLIKNKRILVVGGGITAYHLSRSAVSAGAQVTMITRKYIKIQHFDVSLQWAGRYKKIHLGRFFSLSSPEERYQMLLEARGKGGGTIPPKMYHELRAMHSQSNSTFKLMEQTEVTSVDWRQANISSTGEDPYKQTSCERNYWCVQLSNGLCIHADHIWLATGRALDANKEPLFSEMLHCHPIPVVHGLPVLHPSLRWAQGWDVFVLGAYAALTIGPDAINLAGARAGSLRLFEAVSAQDVIQHKTDQEVQKQQDDANKPLNTQWVCFEEDLNPYTLLEHEQ